jgi:hypothetical protein
VLYSVKRRDTTTDYPLCSTLSCITTADYPQPIIRSALLCLLILQVTIRSALNVDLQPTIRSALSSNTATDYTLCSALLCVLILQATIGITTDYLYCNRLSTLLYSV